VCAPRPHSLGLNNQLLIIAVIVGLPAERAVLPEPRVTLSRKALPLSCGCLQADAKRPIRVRLDLAEAADVIGVVRVSDTAQASTGHSNRIDATSAVLQPLDRPGVPLGSERTREVAAAKGKATAMKHSCRRPSG